VRPKQIVVPCLKLLSPYGFEATRGCVASPNILDGDRSGCTGESGRWRTRVTPYCTARQDAGARPAAICIHDRHHARCWLAGSTSIGLMVESFALIGPAIGMLVLEIGSDNLAGGTEIDPARTANTSTLPQDEKIE
jgi:hypothetical protein